jgi:hypothetical protein
MFRDDVKWWAGLVASVALTLTAQADLLTDPIRRYVAIVGLVATVVSAYKITPGGSVKP